MHLNNTIAIIVRILDEITAELARSGYYAAGLSWQILDQKSHVSWIRFSLQQYDEQGVKLVSLLSSDRRACIRSKCCSLT